jgi:hypothetical protein
MSWWVQSRFARILLRFCHCNSRGRVTEARSKLKRGGRGVESFLPHLYLFFLFLLVSLFFFSHILPLISMEFLAVGVLAPARSVPVWKPCCGPDETGKLVPLSGQQRRIWMLVVVWRSSPIQCLVILNIRVNILCKSVLDGVVETQHMQFGVYSTTDPLQLKR